MSGDYYYTIEKDGYAEYKDRGSKFLAFAFAIKNIDDFKKRLQTLKEEHPKAAHHCFAYRLGIDGNNFRSSDDGEPSGSAGKPILGQIDSKQLTNIAVIIIRYFGGTLLGIPGLINAYKISTTLALQTTPAIQKPIEVNYQLQFDYTKMNEVMTIIKKYDCSVLSQQLELFCVMEVGIPKKNFELVMIKLKDIYGVEIDKMIE
jgi:uncharacterized YigZ family protein